MRTCISTLIHYITYKADWKSVKPIREFDIYFPTNVHSRVGIDINQSAYVHSNEGLSDCYSILDKSYDRMSAIEEALLKTLIGMDILFAMLVGSGIRMDVNLARCIHSSSCFVVISST